MRRLTVWILAVISSPTVVGTASAAGAVDQKPPLTTRDQARLESFNRNRADTIAAARKGGEPNDVVVLDEVLSGKLLPFDESFDPRGGWRCRKLVLDGAGPALYTYSWFECQIGSDETGWFLDKVTGSQRTSGYLYADRSDRLIYLGGYYASDEIPVSYGEDPERDEVAYVVRPDVNRLRFEFPAGESELAILDVRRDGTPASSGSDETTAAPSAPPSNSAPPQPNVRLD